MNLMLLSRRFYMLWILMLFFCIDLPLSSCSRGLNSPSKRQEEKLTAVGWIQNPYAEYLHTVIGFKTTDSRLLNLIFPGVHQQLVDGMYCRITFHRLTDSKHLPEFIRNTKLDYFLLDEVELLPLPDTNKKEKKSENQKKEN